MGHCDDLSQSTFDRFKFSPIIANSIPSYHKYNGSESYEQFSASDINIIFIIIITFIVL